MTDKEIVQELENIIKRLDPDRGRRPIPAVIENSTMKPEPIRPFILAAIQESKNVRT